MGELADNQNAILRALYEDWHAPLDLLEKLTRRVPGGLTTAAKQAGWEMRLSAEHLHRKLLDISDTELKCFEDGGESVAAPDCKTSELKIKLLTGAAKLVDALATTEGKLAGHRRTAANDEGINKKNTKDTPDEPSGDAKFDDQFYYTPAGEAELNRQISKLVERMF